MTRDAQTSLIEKGKLSADKGLIKSSYDLALSSVARLAPFAETGESLDLSSDINTRQTQLAVDDIVHLAISLRRLISGTDMYGVMKNLHVPKVVFLRKGKTVVGTKIAGHISIWTLLNRLVHSVKLEIVSQTYQVLLDLSEVDAWHLINSPADNKLKPICLTRSEKEPLIAFHVAAYCEASSKALELVAERATDFDLYLEDFYNS